MSKSVTAVWLNKVRRLRELYSLYSDRVGHSTVPSGASDEDIEALKRGASQRVLRVDPEYVAFLRILNGTSYDGLFTNGANLANDKDGPSDFIRDNDAPWHDDPTTTRYGTSDIDIYHFNGKNGRFEVLDNGGGDVMESYATFGELADYAVSVVLARRDGNSGIG